MNIEGNQRLHPLSNSPLPAGSQPLSPVPIPVLNTGLNLFDFNSENILNHSSSTSSMTSGHSSSDEENFTSEIDTQDEDIEVVIAKWANRNNVCHSVLDDLLVSLSKFHYFKNLPKDSRTLLRTPVKTVLKNIKGGVYYHFGILNEIEYLMKLKQNLPPKLLLVVGIDGLPITKNPASQLWPILGYFTNLVIEKPRVFIIGAYYGKSKPDDCNEYLEDFVNELCILNDVGITIKDKKINVVLKAIICDSPAKAYVLNIHHHTAKNSCLRCHTIGKYENNRVYFPDLSASMRNHTEFISYSDKDFHCGETILTKIPNFDLINNIPFDYMHCVCIGVMKKILTFWIGGVKKHTLALPKNLIFILDKKINTLGQYIPNEFQRAPNENSRKHPLHDASRLKASELRQILLYTGIVIFSDILSKEIYENFMELCVAMRILSTANISEEYTEFAKSLVNHFVASFAKLYGKSYLSSNMHIIQHLADDTKQYGPLDTFSAFPFENYMQPLKKKIKSGVKPLQQLVRRYTEDQILFKDENQKSKNSLGPINYRCKLKNRPMTNDVFEPQFTGWRMKRFVIKLNSSDNCVKMKNNDVVLIENIASSKLDANIMIIGRKYNTIKNFFEKPCSSNLLNIYNASQLSHLQSWILSDIQEKLICLPLIDNDINNSVILPLLHLQ